MVDEGSHEIASGAGGAPINRDKRPNDTVIDGEVIAKEGAAETDAAKEETASSEAETSPAEASNETAAAGIPRAEKSRSSGFGRSLFAGVLGGAIVAGLAFAGYEYLPPRPSPLLDADAHRLTALQGTASREDAAIAALDKRLGALEAARPADALAALEKRIAAIEGANTPEAAATMEKRLSALEAATKSQAEGVDKRLGQLEAAEQKAASGIQGLQTLSGDVRAMRADVDAARGEIPDIAARLVRLETSITSADLPAIAGKVGKIEGVIAKPVDKAGETAAALAVVAQAVSDKLASGAPLQGEITSLASLGVDPAKLAPLKALADGSPTDHALAASFAALEPKILVALAPPSGGVGDRLLSHLAGLVQVHHLDETAGDDPQALVSQVSARLDRGDLEGALAAFAKLPEPGRRAASSWAAEAGAKRAALAVAQSIRESAVARLAQTAKP